MRFLVISILAAALGFAQAPAVQPGSVINAASFAVGRPVTPGSLISIFGSNLAAALTVASTVPLSTMLGDVSVAFNGVPSPLLFVAPGQINAQLPWNLPTAGNVSMVVNRSTGASPAINVPVAEFSPGIFTIPGGVGQAIAINLDGSLAAAIGSVPGITTRPTRSGDALILLVTGLGAVDQPVPSGQAGGPTTLRNTLTTPQVLVGGVPVTQVLFSGLSPEFPGVNQLNIIVPAMVAPGASVPLQLVLGGITTSNQVTIAVQ